MCECVSQVFIHCMLSTVHTLVCATLTSCIYYVYIHIHTYCGNGLINAQLEFTQSKDRLEQSL